MKDWSAARFQPSAFSAQPSVLFVCNFSAFRGEVTDKETILRPPVVLSLTNGINVRQNV